ncbi:MAG: UBA/THIF-type binding protein [Frankiales bacterium]|nr:UBA/THIF-type binding protein [Frankiales bacterium]
MRPVLIHSAHRVWRDRETLQLGMTPGKAQVLTGVDEGARRVLGLFDGARDVPAVLRDAVSAGCTAERAEEVVRLLMDEGLLRDAEVRWPPTLPAGERDRLVADVISLSLLDGDGAPRLARRHAAAVLVVGAGRVGAPLAALLASAGVGTVDVVDDGLARPSDAAPGGLTVADVGINRGEAARRRVREHAPGVHTGAIPQPDLVVLAPVGAAEQETVHALLRGSVPHLLATVRETVGVVGPLVLPGRSACLACLDQARTDRDPDWPVIAAQLAMPSRRPQACDQALAASVAAQAALQVLGLLDGESPASLDASLELTLPDWAWRRRSWTRHPACACQWQATG